MKRKWLALVMTATMALTSISPVAYAEDISESNLEEAGEYSLEQFSEETEEEYLGAESQEDADLIMDDIDNAGISSEENEEEILLGEETEFDSQDAEEEIIFDETENFDEGDASGEENSVDMLSALQEEFAVSAYSSANDAPYSSVDKLENGVYTVTANVYVPGELNKVLIGTNAFLTNPKYPFASGANYGRPDRPMYYNAQLTVNDDDITVTLELKNPVFQALQINDGNNVVVSNKTYNEELSTSEIHKKYGNKIQTVTFKLKDYSGFYPLGDCKEFASILYTEGNPATETDAVWNVPMNLAVDFQGIGKEEKTVTTNFLNEELGVALITQRELPEGTEQDMHEVTAESSGDEGKLYEEVSNYLNSRAKNKRKLSFRILYIGLKDAEGKSVDNIQNYLPTFYTKCEGFFSSKQTKQAFGRWNGEKFTTHIQRVSSGDVVNDLASLSPEGTELWNDMYSWEEGEFTGGYVVLYDTSAQVLFDYHVESSEIGMTYYSVSGGSGDNSYETIANTYYRIKTATNQRGISDTELEKRIKQDSNYKKVNMSTYQVAMYASNQDPQTEQILAHMANKTGFDIELPLVNNKNFKLYKIVYDKSASSYEEVSEITDYQLADQKIVFNACPLTEDYDNKIKITQMLYGAVADDSYKGNGAGSEIQYYAIVTEGAVAEKPAVSTSEYTYNGSDISVASKIPESQYYTVSGDVSKKLPGIYHVTVTLKDGYAWTDGTTDPVEFDWTIKALQANKPVAVSGLTYNGSNQTGVKAGTGYNLAGTYAAKDAGSYNAKVLLAEGYEWSDGTTDPLTLTWSIAKKKVAKPTATANLVYNGKAQTGVKAGEGYTVSGNVQTKAGTYAAVATLDKNYAWSDGSTGAANVSWSIDKAAQKVNVKVASKSYKVTTVKKKAQSFTIGASASGKITYKVTGTPSKSAAKYLTVDKNGKVTVKKGAPAGTYTITVSAAATDTYKAATAKVTVKVTKVSQKVTAKVSSKTIKSKTIAKRNTSFSLKAKGKGKLTYKVTATPANAAKYISVSKNGKVTVKKKAPKGTYKITVTAAGNATYASGSKTITVKVK